MKTSDILVGDVLFCWGDGFLKDTIELVTHGAYHCAIFIDNETVAEAQGMRKSGTSSLSSYLESGDKLEVWRDTTLTDDERNQIVKYANNHFGIEYDYFAILMELIRFELGISITDFHEGKKRICSSFVNDCAKSVGKNWSNVDYVPAPIDLLKSGKLTFVGKLNN